MSGSNGREPIAKVPDYVSELVKQVRRCRTCGAPFPRTVERCLACGDQNAVEPTLDRPKPKANPGEDESRRDTR